MCLNWGLFMQISDVHPWSSGKRFQRGMDSQEGCPQQQHLSTPPLTLSMPPIAVVVPHHSRGLLILISAVWFHRSYLKWDPSSLYSTAVKKIHILVVGNKYICFIPAKGDALPQTVLHLPMFSWYILYFFFNKIFFSLKFSKKAREGWPSTVMVCKHHLKDLSGAASTTWK